MKIFARGYRSVLTAQPRKSLKYKINTLFCTIIIISSIIIIFTPKIISKTINIYVKYSSQFKSIQETKFTVLIKNPEQIDDYSRSVINTISRKDFFSKNIGIKKVLPVIFNYGIFEQSEIIRDGITDFRIELTLRSPSFCVFNGKLKYVDANGIIFGSSTKKESCKNGILRGFLQEKQGLSFTHRTPWFQLSTEDTYVVQAAIDLRKILVESAINFKKELYYHDTRGFVVHLENPTIEVIIGLPPYEQKIKRMREILSKNESNSLERIELDYANKAFVKKTKPDSLSQE
jgi:hypothetical protein